MSRPYVGFDAISDGKKPGTEALLVAIQEKSGRKVWNNGSWNVRRKRGSGSNSLRGMSVHATGRAFDLSRRNWGGRPGTTRADMLKVIDWFISVEAEIGLEYLADYEYDEKGHAGRGWKCDRMEWRDYKPGVIRGGGWGDWIHVELDEEHATSTEWIEVAMATFPLKPGRSAAPKKVKWETCRKGDTGDNVKQAQKALADKGYKNSSGKRLLFVDGIFGPNTDKRTRQFQKDASIVVDGIFGPQTAGAIGII